MPTPPRRPFAGALPADQQGPNRPLRLRGPLCFRDAPIDIALGDQLLVTKRGKPVAKLIPVERGGGALLGRLKGKIQVKGDLLSTGIRWDADAES